MIVNCELLIIFLLLAVRVPKLAAANIYGYSVNLFLLFLFFHSRALRFDSKEVPRAKAASSSIAPKRSFLSPISKLLCFIAASIRDINESGRAGGAALALMWPLLCFQASDPSRASQQ